MVEFSIVTSVVRRRLIPKFPPVITLSSLIVTSDAVMSTLHGMDNPLSTASTADLDQVKVGIVAPAWTAGHLPGTAFRATPSGTPR